MLGVIVLTDNRQHVPADKLSSNAFRCSAFRCRLALRQRLKPTRSSSTRSGGGARRGSRRES